VESDNSWCVEKKRNVYSTTFRVFKITRRIFVNVCISRKGPFTFLYTAKKVVANDAKKKPEMILLRNKYRAEFNTMDQAVGSYTNRRYLLATDFFSNIIDLTYIASRIIRILLKMTKRHRNKLTK